MANHIILYGRMSRRAEVRFFAALRMTDNGYRMGEDDGFKMAAEGIGRVCCWFVILRGMKGLY